MATLKVWPKFTGRSDLLRVSASDVQGLPHGCGLYGALKVRHKLQTPEWSRRRDESQPFLLGVVREICLKLQEDPRIATWEELDQLARAELAQYNLHPGSQRYALRAIENYLDCHDFIEQEIGPLTLRHRDPTVVPDANAPNNQLTVWAPIYDSETGVREVRKLRFDKVRRSTDTPDNWTVTAAHVAGLVRPLGGLQRIRVVEIGLSDGSMQTLFDDTPAAARTAYEAQTLPVLHKIVSTKNAVPGVSCQKCKIAGCCSALEGLDGFLGQARPGHATRSISARDLEIYETCPAQWYLTSANLPAESESSPSSERGRNIHIWLAMAHMRNRGCDSGDIDSSDGSFDSLISEEEYSEVRDYITQHANFCALRQGARVIASEAPIYGYDAKADVIIASKPDLLYIDSDETFVIRETKTTTLGIPQDANEAFDKFFTVPWLLNLFATGYRGPYQSEKARLELEVLTPEEGRVFTWDLSDSGLLRMAKAEVRLRAKGWHKDTTWSSTPGAHCKWCPVRQWCPDARTADEADEYNVERTP